MRRLERSLRCNTQRWWSPTLAIEQSRKDGGRRRERPLAEAMGAEQIEQRSGGGDSRGDGELFKGVGAIDEEKSEAGHGEERRQRIERHAEGAREIGVDR